MHDVTNCVCRMSEGDDNTYVLDSRGKVKDESREDDEEMIYQID